MKIKTNKQFNIVVVKGNDYIILESKDSKEYIESLYLWYVSHNEFFNGSIQLWDNGKCVSKTNGGAQ